MRELRKALWFFALLAAMAVSVVASQWLGEWSFGLGPVW